MCWELVDVIHKLSHVTLFGLCLRQKLVDVPSASIINFNGLSTAVHKFSKLIKFVLEDLILITFLRLEGLILDVGFQHLK
jgi:hypothetical protein